jgi:hypothetical protein
MEVLIGMVWFLLFLTIPVALMTTSYIRYVNGGRVSEIIATSLLSFILYIFVTIGTGWFIFLMIFAGAHTNPVGQALNFQGKLIFCGIVVFYAFLGWLLCSIVNGNLIKPSTDFNWKSEKPPSILG